MGLIYLVVVLCHEDSFSRSDIDLDHSESQESAMVDSVNSNLEWGVHILEMISSLHPRKFNLINWMKLKLKVIRCKKKYGKL